MILFSTLFPQGKNLKDIIVEGGKRVLYGTYGNTLIFDTLESMEWLDPYVNITYKTELKASGETVTPSFAVYLEQNKKGYSGKIYKGGTYYDYSVNYSIVSNNSAFTLNTSTGEVTCDNNTTTSSRSFLIKVSVTLLDSTVTVDKLITFTQEAGTESVSNSEWVTTGITINNNKDLTFTADGGSITLTTRAILERNNYIYWNDKLTDTTIETIAILIIPSYTVTSDWLSINNSILTVNSNQLGNSRSAYITAVYGNYSATIEVSLAEDSKSYGIPIIEVGSGLTAAGSSATISATLLITYKSGKTETININASDITIKNQFKSTSSTASSGTSISRFSKPGNTLKHTSMGIEDGYDNCILTVTANGMTGTKQVLILNEIDYILVNNIEISNFSYPIKAANIQGATTSPTEPNIKITKYDVYKSGSQTAVNTVDIEKSSYILTYSLDNTNFNIDSSTGVCTTRFNNLNSNENLGVVKLTVTLSEIYEGVTSNTATAYIAQLAYNSITSSLTIGFDQMGNCNDWNCNSILESQPGGPKVYQVVKSASIGEITTITGSIHYDSYESLVLTALCLGDVSVSINGLSLYKCNSPKEIPFVIEWDPKGGSAIVTFSCR